MFDMKFNVPDVMGLRDRRDSNDRNQECFTRLSYVPYNAVTVDERGSVEGTSVDLVCS